MTRAQLRLELLRIAHHDRHNVQTVLDIVGRYEAAFADLALDDEKAPQAQAKTGAAKKSAA
jgi:hypothetical protein